MANAKKQKLAITVLAGFGLLLFQNCGYPEASIATAANADTGDTTAEKSAYSQAFADVDCSSTAAGIFHVRSVADLDRVNDTDKRIFCVHPGDYTATGGKRIIFRASGTASAPRYFVYYRPGDDGTHPANMSVAERATLGPVNFDGAKHWIVDRISFRGWESPRASVVAIKGSSGTESILLNEILAERGADGGGLVGFHAYAKNSTLQNSVLRNTTITPGSDNHCVAIFPGAANIKVIGNEISDCAGDGLQVGADLVNNDNRVFGLLVADNDFYFSPGFTYSENAIDLKGNGTADPATFLRFEGNRFWGLQDGAGGTSAAEGALFDFSNDIGMKEYIVLKNNIFWDASQLFGTRLGDNVGRVRKITLVGNIFFQARQYAFDVWRNTENVEFYFNTVVQTSGAWINGHSTSKNHDVKCNTIVDGGSVGSALVNSEVGLNGHFASQPYSPVSGVNLVESSVSASKNTEYCFTYRPHTANLRKCIPHGRIALASLPAACQNGVGHKAGVGVDDRIWRLSDITFPGATEPQTPPAEPTPSPTPVPPASTPTPTPVPNVSEARYQAESATLIAPNKVIASSAAVGGKAVTSPESGHGNLTFRVQVPVDGTYTLKARVRTPTDVSNEIRVRVDGGSLYRIIFPVNASYTEQVLRSGIALKAGAHKIELPTKDRWVEVDELIVIKQN